METLQEGSTNTRILYQNEGLITSTSTEFMNGIFGVCSVKYKHTRQVSKPFIGLLPVVGA